MSTPRARRPKPKPPKKATKSDHENPAQQGAVSLFRSLERRHTKTNTMLPVAVRLDEPLWHTRVATFPLADLSHHNEMPLTRTRRTTFSDDDESCENNDSSWSKLVARTTEAFDESRAYGGFLKTYRPVSLSHMPSDAIAQRRSSLKRLSARSWALAQVE